MTKEMTKQNQTTLILFLGILACGCIGYLDYFANSMTYGVKALSKMGLFVGFPLIYAKINPNFQPKTLFRLEKKPLKLAFALGFGVFAIILGFYFLLGSILDLSAVTTQLESRLKINAQNFVAVAVYIALCNSFLEEFFFRGFLFFQLEAHTNLKFAHCASSLLFSLYHVAIMAAWFDWWVFALCMAGLFIGGFLFNFLDHSCKSLYPSWITHMFANFAINSIGMILFFG